MFTHKKMRAVFAKVDRSDFHRLITPVLPINRKPETKFDAWGGLMVVGLSAGMMVLMRLALAH